METRIQKRWVILLVQFLAIMAMVFSLLPLETGIIITGIIVFFFLFSPLEESVWVFIASLPFFTVLSFEGISIISWRVLVAVLFFLWVFRLYKKNKSFLKIIQKLKTVFFDKFTVLVIIFLSAAIVSLVSAPYPVAGIKKIIYLTSAFIIFLIVKDIIKSKKEKIDDFIAAIKIAIGTTLGVAVIQFLTIFWVPLHTFWHFWAKNIIPVFYGRGLGELLTTSNTWFSYYVSQPPTLRVFSVFPDSHSFALFCILALPFLLVAIFLDQQGGKLKRFFVYFFLILDLLGIIFSGSRGTWASAIGVLIIIFIVFLFKRYFKFLYQTKWKKQFYLISGTLLIFFLLFPIASGIFFLSQKAQSQGGDMGDGGGGLFERARSITDKEEVSARSRLQIWQKSYNSVLSRPFIGIGIGNYPLILEEDIEASTRGASAHNLYLDVASEMGLLGLFVLILIFLAILWDSWFVFRKSKGVFAKSLAGFFLFAFVWMMGYSLFDVVLLNEKVLILFFISLGILYGIKKTEKFKKTL